MKKMLALVALLLCTPVWASEYSEEPIPEPINNTNINGNLNANKNTNKNLNANFNKNTATGGNGYGGKAKASSYAEGGNAKQGQLQGQLQGQQQGNVNKISIQDNSVYEAQKRDPVSSAIAPGLTTSGEDTCMGSSSAGGQGVGVGFSFGTTWTDNHCKMIKAVKLLTSVGLKQAAMARLCVDADMVQALKAEGYECEGPAVGGGVDDGVPLYEEERNYTFDGDDNF